MSQTRLLQKLEAIYVAEGYQRTTMAELAARLRCSKRALYQLAASKEQLFLLVVQQALDEIWRLGLEVVESASGTVQDRIQRYISAAIVPCRRWSPFFLADIEDMPEAHALLAQHLKDRMVLVGKMVDEGVRVGTFRRTNAALVAETIVVSVSRFCSPSFLAQSNVDLSSAVEILCDLLWNGLLHPEDTSAAHGPELRPAARPAASPRPGRRRPPTLHSRPATGHESG